MVERPGTPSLGRKASFWRREAQSQGSGETARRAAAVQTGVPKPHATESSDGLSRSSRSFQRRFEESK